MIRSAALVLAVAVATPAMASVTVAKKDDSKLKLGGKAFINTTDYRKLSNGTQTFRSRSTSIDRAYLTAKYTFDADWMMRITTDVNNEASTATLGKNQQIFLKYAYVEGKLAGKAAVLRLGQSHTPWIDYEQGLWKHRYVSKVMSDEYKYDSSSELGVGLKGKVDMFNYWVTLTDGHSYSGARNYKNGTTGTDFNARIGVTPLDGLTVDLQYIQGFNGTKTSTTAGTKQDFVQLMVTYGMGHDFRVGVNYAADKQVNEATQLLSKKSDAVALWGWANFGDGFGAFGRLEKVKDKKAVINAEKKNRYVVGLEYAPTKHVNFSLAYDYSKTTDKGSVAGVTAQAYRYGLYSQVKF